MVLRDRDLNLDGDMLDAGERHYALHDANFNVTAITGTVAQRYLYDPYGQATVLAANWQPTTANHAWQYLHQGGRYDFDTGLYHFRNRNYSAELGRWVQQDPLGYVDGMSLYEYVRSKPVSLNDPSGLLPLPGPEDMLLIDHYERGKGELLQLTGRGWYNKILPSAPAQAIQQGAIAKAREFARNTALNMGCDKTSGNFQTQYITPADFTNVVFSIGNTNVRTLLVCDIGVKCMCCNGKNMPYEYGAVCRTFHVILDRFEDALDIFDVIPGRQELPTGTPFTFIFAWEGPNVTVYGQLPLPCP